MTQPNQFQQRSIQYMNTYDVFRRSILQRITTFLRNRLRDKQTNCQKIVHRIKMILPQSEEFLPYYTLHAFIFRCTSQACQRVWCSRGRSTLAISINENGKGMYRGAD